MAKKPYRINGKDVVVKAENALYEGNINEADNAQDAIDNLDERVSEIEENGTGGFSAEDIVNDLITGGTEKPLSAEQGKVLGASTLRSENVSYNNPSGEVIEWEVGGISALTGENVTSNNRCRTVEFLPCFDTIQYNMLYGYIYILLYDEKKRFISSSYHASSATVDVGNARYFRVYVTNKAISDVATLNTTDNKYYTKSSNSLGGKYGTKRIINDVAKNYVDELNSVRLPINLCIMGDSIGTQAQGLWGDMLKERYRPLSLNNLAIGQARWTHANSTVMTDSPTIDYTTNVISNQVMKLVAGIQAGTYRIPDVVLIHCGVNDRGYATGDDTFDITDDADVTMYGDVNEVFKAFTPVDAQAEGVTETYTNADGVLKKDGNLLDYAHAYNGENGGGIIQSFADTRLRTMAGGMRFAIELIWKYYPQIRVICTTPIHVCNNRSDKVIKIGRVIKQVCSMLSVPVIDLTKESGINPFRRTFQSDDGLHPSVTGALYMCDLIGHELMRRYAHSAPIPLTKRTAKITVLNSTTDEPMSGVVMRWAMGGIAMFINETDPYNMPATDANGVTEMQMPAAHYTLLRNFQTVADVNLTHNDVDLTIKLSS